MPETPIRAIVSRFSFDFSHAAMEAVLRERPFEFCAVISAEGGPRFFSAIPESAQQWFDSGAIRGCTYEGVGWNDVQPLDEELLEHLRPCETLFYQTVCRLEWKYAIPYGMRRHWYMRHLRFWNDYVQRQKINLYLAAWLPHEIPDVILYHLCKYRGIPVVYFHMSTERDMAFLEHDIERPAPQLGTRYEELLQEFGNISDPMAVPLTPNVEERYRVLTAPSGEKPALASVKHPTYWQRLRQLASKRPAAVLQHGMQYLTTSGVRRIEAAWRRWRDIRARNAYYDTHAIHPDLSQKFVYFPLHFQPEASTVPMAGAYTDQLLIAQLLNAHLPEDVLIYVKEHPVESSWFSRSVKYYRDLLALPKVRLIARDVDTFALRERCAAVATATGSAGFEGLFRGKPALMFGHRFYQYARGVYQIHATEDLKRAVHAIFQDKSTPTLMQCRIFLKAMEETCVPGTLVPWDRKVSRRSDEDHIRAYSTVILEELQRLEGDIAAVRR